MRKRVNLLPSGVNVIVLGSLNAKPQDRTLSRSEIVPVQLVRRDGIAPINFFNSWGELGVSSMAWHPGTPMVVYVTTGDNLAKIDLEKREVKFLDIPLLVDVHEMTVIGGSLWLANTGRDEVIVFDIEREKVLRRHSLSAFKSVVEITECIDGNMDADDVVEVKDKFHCNQVFQGLEGHTYVLVHHVTGKQLVRRIAQRLVKSQGDGGVINLDTGTVVRLGLKGPHSVRKIGGEYWLFDSGNATINVYNSEWNLKQRIPTRGWGRGADCAESHGLFFAGISATRRRYLGLVKAAVPNMVEVFSLETRARVGEIILENIEQVNNVYVISDEQAHAFLLL